jgi:DNA-directed RNA polymerase specialized sigma24 family protein
LNSDPKLHRDLLLLRKITERDKSALCELLEERGPAVLGVLCRLLNKAEAEDVLVDVFASIWTEAPRFEPNGRSPFSWMLCLAKSLATERLRVKRGVSGLGCYQQSGPEPQQCRTGPLANAGSGVLVRQ